MYVNDLPNCLRNAAPRMFAEDTNITISAKTVADLKLAVTSGLITRDLLVESQKIKFKCGQNWANDNWI